MWMESNETKSLLKTKKLMSWGPLLFHLLGHFKAPPPVGCQRSHFRGHVASSDVLPNMP